VLPFKTHKIAGPSNTVETSVAELLDMYTLMYRMRRMEVAADMMYKAKLIRGFCHL
jgi:pyruvate dehydrogenase E1 component alpha subunit